MKSRLILMVLMVLTLNSCKKFLDEKPNKILAVPTKFKDLQALLDDNVIMNFADGSSSEISSGDFYLSNADFLALGENDRNMYTWQRSKIYKDELNEWALNYRIVYRSNAVLAYGEKIVPSITEIDYSKNVLGQAYFYRAKAFLQTLFVWANAYDKNSSNDDLGIPLRLNTDFNIPSIRSSVNDSYAQVLSDLKKASALLPATNVHVMRPSKAAAFGLLSRTFLTMRDYANAKKYSDSSLMLKSDLLDYNTLSSTSNFPIPQFNIEILHSSYVPAFPILNNSRAKIDPTLVNMFEVDDLRKTIFLKNNNDGTFGFKGSYEGSASLFSGVAVDEVLLIQAECLARDGKLVEALNNLNKLGIKRYKSGTYKIKSSNDPKIVLDWILNERRKELLFRRLRWIEIKRLNKEGANISLFRNVNNSNYKLEANSTGFALPLPDNLLVISNMKQNP